MPTLVSTGQITIVDQNDGLNLRLSNPAWVIPTDAAGLNGNFTGCSTTASVMQGITDDSAKWTVTAAPSSGVTGSFSGKTYTVTAMSTNTGYVDFTASRVGFPSLTARFSLSKARAGNHGLTVVLPNASTTLPANSSGAVQSYTNSGSTLQVYDGSTALTYTTGTLGMSQFSIGTPTVSPAGALTVGAITGSGTTTATIANHSGMGASTDSVTLTFLLTVKRADGTSVTLNAVQTVTKSRAGETALIYAIHTSSPVVFKTAPNATTAGEHRSITVQGKKIAGSATTNYGWVTVTANGATEATTATDTATTPYTLAPANTDGKTTYTIRLYNQAAVAGATLLDTQVVPVVFAGASGAATVTAVLSNESHNVPTDKDGNNGTFTGASTTMSVYVGSTDDSANWTYSASKSSGVTCSEAATSRTQTVTAMTTDSGYVDITASRTGYSPISRRFSVVKSRAGATGGQGALGPTVSITSSRASAFTATDGTLDAVTASVNTDITFTAATTGMSGQTYAWSFAGFQTAPANSGTNTQVVTAAQFGTAKSAKVTCTVTYNGVSYKDDITIVRLEKSTAAAGATVGAPAGTQVGGVDVAVVAGAVQDFNTSNNRNATPILAPLIYNTGSAVDHVLHNDGSADISLEWSWPYSCIFSGTISGTTLTVSELHAGTITVGAVLLANSGIAANTYITGFGTGTGGVGTYTVNNSQTVATSTWTWGSLSASVVGAISGDVLTVTSVNHGALRVGQSLSGTGIRAGTYIKALGTGTGGAGTYTVSASHELGSRTISASISEGDIDGFLITVYQSSISTATLSAVDITLDTLTTSAAHGFVTGQPVLYTVPSGGSPVGGLTSGATYYAHVISSTQLKLARTEDDAKVGTTIDFTSTWGGTGHTLKGGKAYSIGTSTASETQYTVPANKRAFILFSAAADKAYTFGVSAYRAVDKAVNSTGMIKSDTVKPLRGSENPYLPTYTVAFAGNVTGTISGTSASTVVSNAASGKSAYDAVNSSTSGLATKLSKASSEILNIATSGTTYVAGLRVGDITWDASGNRTSGKGLALTPNGIGGHNGTQMTFAVGADGNAVFAGSLSAATGTFSGSLSAATGTFSGTLTASAVNAVNTINIAGNAVTIPLGVYSKEAASVGNGTFVSIQSLSIASSGSPIIVIAAAELSDYSYVELRRGSTVLHSTSTSGSYSFSLVDTPGAGTHTYAIYSRLWNYSFENNGYRATNRSIALIEAKR